MQELPQKVHVVSGEEFQITCTATNHQDSPNEHDLLLEDTKWC